MAPPQQTLLKEILPSEPLVEFLALAEARGFELSLYGEEEYYVTSLRHSAEFHQRWFGPPFHPCSTYTDGAPCVPGQGQVPIKGLMIVEPGEGEPVGRRVAARVLGAG